MTALYHHHDTRAIVHRLRVRLARRERRERPGAQRAVDRRNAWRNRSLMRLGYWPDGTVMGWALAQAEHAIQRLCAIPATPYDAGPTWCRIGGMLGLSILLWLGLLIIASEVLA